MTAIIDYGVGNLFSLESSLKAIGETVIITKDVAVLEKSDRLILPGVGAFRDARKALSSSGLEETVIRLAKEGKPLLGICLGMQLLFDKDYEDGEYAGLSLIPGSVVSIADSIGSLKTPHIGWNSLIFNKSGSKLFKYINDRDYVYFVHSYHACCSSDYISTKTEYGALLTASVERDNIYGCQFHPEKSGEVGLSILRAFVEIT